MESRQEIEMYFASLDEAIGKQLELKDSKVQTYVYGGGALIGHQMEHRKSTQDIDVVFLNVPDSANPDQMTQALFKAVRSVAKKHRLAWEWFNDSANAVNDFRDMMPQPELEPWFEGNHLQVLLLSKRCLLGMKLMAGRRKDDQDIEVLLEDLQIETREQAQALVDQFIPDRQRQEIDKLARTLDELF